MIRRIRIRKHQLGLVFRHGDLHRVIGPGKHWARSWFLGTRVEVYDTLDTRFQHPRLDALIAEARLREHLEVVDLSDDQIAFVWKDGRLDWVLPAGRYAFWKGAAQLEIERHTVTANRFEHPRLATLLEHEDSAEIFQVFHAEQGKRLLFFRDGRLIETVDDGVAVFWSRVQGLTSRSIDLREQVAVITGQDIMTADKVTLRVTLLTLFRVHDAECAVTQVANHEEALYREAQLALRKSVGARTLDVLLTDKEAMGAEITSAVAERVAPFGLTVANVGLRDILLPGEMKAILNQVIEAQKQAEANVIRRREETAAARSQANTARLLAANPILARMKELEAVQEILAGTQATFLFGKGDLVRQVRDLTEATPADEG